MQLEYYKDMLDITRELKYYFSLSSLLNWDSQTHMPTKGASFRAQQVAFLEEKVISILANSNTKRVLSNLSAHKSDLDEFQLRNYQVFARAVNRRTVVPSKLLIENKKQESITFNAWQEGKRKKNFKLYAPELVKNIVNKQNMARYVDPEKIPFDVYLDDFEPGFTSEKIEKIFNQLKPEILSLLHKIQNSGVTIPNLNNFSLTISKQEKLVHEITNYIGFDLRKGSIDYGEHPMTINLGSPDDVRFTVNYDEANYLSALFAGLHEAGHAIHGQNTDKKNRFFPIGLFGSSAGISESQSRFFENIVGRSEAFWSYYFSKLPPTIQKIGLSDFLQIINQVQLSKIRIKADELTYPLHIILRFEIEKGLLDGSIQVNELPSVWNEKIKEYFGLEIKDDAEGVLQDIHWATVFYGYFPTYALGNIYNSQMYYTMKKELDFDTLLTNGTIEPVRNWLIENVHKKTGLYDPEDFIKVITQESVNPDYFIKYLEQKFSKIYEFG